MILWKCALWGSKKSRLIKKQEAKGLLRRLGLKTPLNKIPVLDDNFLWVYKTEWKSQ